MLQLTRSPEALHIWSGKGIGKWPILVACPFLVEFFLVLAGFPCKLCPPGSFNNETRAQTCECCPDGYSSTYMKTSCRPCPANEWAKHENFPNCSLCQTCFTPEDCKYLCLDITAERHKHATSEGRDVVMITVWTFRDNGIKAIT